MYVCLPLPVSRDVGGLCSCPGHQVTCALTNSPHSPCTHQTTAKANCVQKWPSLRINHYEKQHKREQRTLAQWNSRNKFLYAIVAGQIKVNCLTPHKFFGIFMFLSEQIIILEIK